MNPQPVSLADELRKLAAQITQDLQGDGFFKPMNASYVLGRIEGRLISALLAQHAVAEPPRKWICTCAEGKDGRPVMDKDCMVHAPDPAGAYAGAGNEVTKLVDAWWDGAVLDESNYHELVERITALLAAAHAVEQPKLTEEQVRSAWIGAEAKLKEENFVVGLTRGLNALLTSPVEKENPDAS